MQGEVLLPDCLVEVPLYYVYQGSWRHVFLHWREVFSHCENSS